MSFNSAGGGLTLAAVDNEINSQKGSANGLASLDSGSKVPAGQIPTISHSGLSNLSNDDHSQYFKVTGRTNENLTLSGTGQILHQDGSASRPAYSFTNNNNLGLYRSAANKIGIAAQGTEVVEFDLTGGGPYARANFIGSGGQGWLSVNGTLLLQLVQSGSPIVSTGGDFGAGLSNQYFGSNSYYGIFSYKYGLFGSGGLAIGIDSGSQFNPNYHLDLRQNTPATAVYAQWSIKTTTGNTSSDGLLVGLDSAGKAVINQQENADLTVSTNNTPALVIKASGAVLAQGAIGVGNSASASVAVGTLVKKIEIFDASGASLGFIPVYSSIT